MDPGPRLRLRYEKREHQISPAKTFRFTALALFLIAITAFVQYTSFSKGNSHGVKDSDVQVLSFPVLNHDERPLSSPSTNESCRGPNGIVPFPVQYRTPSSYPVTALGSYTLTNIDPQKCMTYNDRYQPYSDRSLGTSYLNEYYKWLSLQSDTSKLGSIAATQLSIANEKANEESVPHWRELMDDCDHQQHSSNKKKTVVILRAYENYTWRADDILNVRALIVELSLNKKERFDVRILVDVHQRNLSIFSSTNHRREVLSHSVPREFWSLTEVWNEDSLKLLYPDLPSNLRGWSAHSSYRSCFMPVQKFALEHTEYDYIWNWEMDTRFTGNYEELFERSAEFAKREALDPSAAKYKSWLIFDDAASEGTWATPKDSKGVGEEADLIVYNPIFDPRDSGWYWTNDFQNYRGGLKTDRRASIGRNVRFSKRLLNAMNTINAQDRKSAHCETWPATVVLHSNQEMWQIGEEYDPASTVDLARSMKAVYIPHPVHFARNWSPAQLSSALSRHDVYAKVNEKALRSASFYGYDSRATELNQDWKDNDRSCMSPVLLHPVRRIRG